MADLTARAGLVWSDDVVGSADVIAAAGVRSVADSTRLRVAFVNSGILGHTSVARLLADCAREMPDVDDVHVDLGRNLNWLDRGLRGVLSVRLAPIAGPLANLDLRRWRQELNVGLLAKRRLDVIEASGRFDVLHFHTQASAYASLARMRRTPAIVSIDITQTLASTELPPGLARHSYGPNILHDRLVFRAAAAITATSQWAARDLTERYPECAHKVHVMPYPVRPLADDSWIDARWRRAAETCRVGRDASRPRALFIGGDFARKGGDDLLAAWHDDRLHEVAALDLVTSAPLAPDRLPTGVRHITGVAAYSPEWQHLWRQADLFVMPSRAEAFGMVYQEAAAAGLPVVATRLAAIPEIVSAGETGLLVPPGDPAALARAIRELAASRDLRRQLGAAALDGVRRTATIEGYAARLHNLLTTAVFEHGFHHA